MNKGCLFTSLQQGNQLCPHCFVSVRVKERLKKSRLYQVKIANIKSMFNWEAFY